MSNSNTKKKEVPLNDTFYNLCKDLLRFIDRKIIKKYISPNIAQLPKEMRNHENKIDKQNEVWTYFYKDKEVTKEEKIKDVFKDDIFLGHLQNLNNSLNIVLDYLEQNQINIKKLEDDVKNKEEQINNLNELKNLLNNYFEKNNDTNTGNQENTHILEDKNLLNIMNKIQSFNSYKFNDAKITENVIRLNDINNNNINNNIINNNNKNNQNDNNIKINKIENILNNCKKSKTPQKIQKKYIPNNIQDLDKTFSNMNNINNNNEIRNQNNQCLSAPVIDRISNIKKENDKIEPNSKDKKEIDFLIDHFKITSNVCFNSDKREKNEDIKQEKNSPFPYLNNNDNDNNQENLIDNNFFLQKKLEREQGIIDIEDGNFNDNFNKKKINNNEGSSLENKKGKNKKKSINAFRSFGRNKRI
jgi:hypothetical protein